MKSFNLWLKSPARDSSGVGVLLLVHVLLKIRIGLAAMNHSVPERQPPHRVSASIQNVQLN